MDTMDIIESIAEENSGIITNRTALERNVSRATLSYLCAKEKITRIAAGQYIIQNEFEDELYSISLRSSNIVFSHETALFLHGLSDRTPFLHSITAPCGNLPSTSLRGGCKVYTIKPELFELGVTTITTQFGNNVKVYDLERTLCDIVRSRSRVGTETFLSAVKAYSKRPDKNLNVLSDYANRMGITNILKTYLEVLL